MNISYLSLITQENLTNNRNKISDSLNKLSSGLKINKASDDASGLAISDKLRTQASGIKQAISNANSAVAFAQIGDKAMAEQSNILDFTKQKLIQAATMTTSDEGRQMILADIQKSLTQYDQIASTTNYNGITILQKSSDDQGESSEHTFQVGDNAKDIVSIEVVQANTSYGGGNQVDTLTISGEIKEKDIFTVVINEIPISYVASSLDVGTSSNKHNQLALGLKSEIESNNELSKLITVENTSNGILQFSSKSDGQTFTINPGTITLNTDISLGSSSSLPAVAQEMTYEFTGTIESEDTFTVGGVSYTVQDSDSSMNDIVDKIVEGLNGTDGGSIIGLNVTSTLSDATASRNSLGNLVLTANIAGIAFTPLSYSASNLTSIDDQLISTSTVQNNVKEILAVEEKFIEKTVQWSGTTTIQEADRYYFTVNGYSMDFVPHLNPSVTTKEDLLNFFNNKLLNAPSTNTSDALYGVTFSLSGDTFTFKSKDAINISAWENVIRTPAEHNYEVVDTESILQEGVVGSSVNVNNYLPVTSKQELTKTVLKSNIQVGATVYIGFTNGSRDFYDINNDEVTSFRIGYTVQSGDTKEDIVDGLINTFNNDSRSNTLVKFYNGTALEDVNQFSISKDANGDIITGSYQQSAYRTINNTFFPEVSFSSYSSTYEDEVGNTIDDYIRGPSLYGRVPDTPNLSPIITNINDSYISPVSPISPENQQEKYTLSGTIEKGDKYNIAGITYQVQSSDITIEDVVDKLIIGLNGATATGLSGTSTLTSVTASKDSTTSLLLTADVAGTPFTLPSFEALNVGTNDQAISLINTIDNVPAGAKSFYDISGFINEGNIYNIGGAIYTAQSGDSKEDIIDGLVKSINGDSASGVSGSPLSGVVAFKTPPPIQVLIKPSITYTISASVNLSNITSDQIKNDLSINSSNVATFESSTSKYETYTEDSTIKYDNETQDIDTQNLQRVRSLASLKNLDYLTIDIAKEFMSIVDENLTTINEFRGRFGSAQNQLESATRNLMTSYVNIKNAESIIRDIDYAIESANFNKLNIITQAGSFALSQSYKQVENILNLLK
tara:strand:- start:599 stop:3811 length:3213 start_codon:yes stop_codon:yes gene_type:complete